MANDEAGAGKARSRRKAPGTTGRVTPKGTRPAPRKGSRRGAPTGPSAAAPDAAPSGGSGAPAASRRYTPPVPHEKKTSPSWVPVLMFALLGIGILVIIANYVGLLPGGSDNRYLLLGLAAITGGFITATQYR